MSKNSVQIKIPNKNNFEDTSYIAYTPECKKAQGKYFISRLGLIFPDHELYGYTLYSNIHSRVLVVLLSAASFWKRGYANFNTIEDLGIVHSNWSNGYYHWITESLPRSLKIITEFPDATIALPSKTYAPFVESLNAIGINKIAFFPDEKNVIVENPIISNCPSRFATTHPECLNNLVQRIRNNLGISASSIPSRIVYASRRKARGRKILNEAQLITKLHDFGIEEICFEDLTFRQQIEVLSETKILIGMHGAGLTNLIFMPTGGKVIEILPKRNSIFDYNKMRGSFKHDSCYIRLASAFSIHHHDIICNHDAKFYKKTHMSNIFLEDSDIQKIVRIIDTRNDRMES